MKKFRDLDWKKKRNYIVLLGTVYVWLFLLSLQKAYQTISECGSCNESNRWIVITAIFGGLAIERARSLLEFEKRSIITFLSRIVQYILESFHFRF